MYNNKYFKSNKGSIAVLSLAFFMITIFVFGYIIDTQRLQLARQKLYIASDMAALAGAREIDEDKAMGLESALPDSPANGPIAEIDKDKAEGVVQTIIDANQFDKGGQTWLGHDNNKIFFESGDVEVDNGDYTNPEERRMATIRVTSRYIVKPFVLSIMNYNTEVKAQAKSVIYLVM